LDEGSGIFMGYIMYVFYVRRHAVLVPALKENHFGGVVKWNGNSNVYPLNFFKWAQA
jgi:hypothetical protein